VKVVCGGLILKQPAPLAWTQYHQFAELSVDGFHAREMLVAELAVIRRLVGVVGAVWSLGGGGGAGLFAGAAEMKTSARTRALATNAVLRKDIWLLPGGVGRCTGRYGLHSAPDLLEVGFEEAQNSD
jgi:hypothetical protein